MSAQHSWRLDTKITGGSYADPENGKKSKVWPPFLRSTGVFQVNADSMHVNHGKLRDKSHPKHLMNLESKYSLFCSVLIEILHNIYIANQRYFVGDLRK